MKKAALASFLGLTSCLAHHVKTEPDDLEIHTISYVTGQLADDGLYYQQFHWRARELCDGPYKIIERGRAPSTLAGYQVDADEFFWVIACED